MPGQRIDFFGRSPEYRRVAALQPHDAMPGLRGFDEQRIDRRLASRMPTGALADRHADCVRRDEVEHARPNQRVVKDNARRRDQPLGLARQQVGIAGAGPNQPDIPGSNKLSHAHYPLPATRQSPVGTIRNWCLH